MAHVLEMGNLYVPLHHLCSPHSPPRSIFRDRRPARRAAVLHRSSPPRGHRTSPSRSKSPSRLIPADDPLPFLDSADAAAAPRLSSVQISKPNALVRPRFSLSLIPSLTGDAAPSKSCTSLFIDQKMPCWPWRSSSPWRSSCSRR